MNITNNKTKKRNREKLDIEIIKILYKTKNAHEIGKIFNCSYSKIIRLLRLHNIRIKPAREVNRKYFCDSHFFENPANWEQKHAYFLGWLLSDGYHAVYKKQLAITLQEKDKQILEILKDIIQFTGPLNFIKKRNLETTNLKTAKNFQNNWRLAPVDHKISEDLLKLKIDNNKSDNLKFPTYLRKDLVPHFLRGYYEGDGTFSFSYREGNYKQLTFDIHLIGTPDLCFNVKRILKDTLDINSIIRLAPRVKNGNLQLRFGGYINSLKFFLFLYKDAKFMLKRKFRKFLRLINHIKRKINNIHSQINTQENQRLLKESIILARFLLKNSKY